MPQVHSTTNAFSHLIHWRHTTWSPGNKYPAHVDYPARHALVLRCYSCCSVAWRHASSNPNPPFQHIPHPHFTSCPPRPFSTMPILPQGIIQSAFLWGYMATQLVGGTLADRYGGKRVLAGGMAWFSLASLLLPCVLSPSLTPAIMAAGLTVPVVLVSRFLVVSCSAVLGRVAVQCGAHGY